VLQQARTLVVQGLNTGANDATANSAIAQQVDALRTSLLSLANTAYNGRPVFGGTTAAGAAYDSSGSYVGDAGSVSRMVGPNTTVSVSGHGPTVFGSGSSDVFAMLSSIAGTLRSAPSSLSGSLGDLDAAISRVSSAQATEGATYQQVQRAQTAQTTASTSLTTQLSTIEDVDPAQLAIEVTTANTAYQAALQTTASIRQLSLLDFLR
jgi:flagellar hook-associated protein 3 FlgL